MGAVGGDEAEAQANTRCRTCTFQSHEALLDSFAIGLGVYQFCRRFPERAKKILVGQVKKHLGDSPEVTENFTPHYAPWDQRLCFVPDDDLFDAIKRGAASVVTDRIETFTETGIRLRSGREIDADVIVTATGAEILTIA